MRRSLIFTDPEDEAAAPPKKQESPEPKDEESSADADHSVPKDEEVSADVDRLMDRITELRRLTIESLEVDVERASPEQEDDSEFSFTATDCKRDAVIHEHPSHSGRSSPRSSKTSKTSGGLAESAFAIARLEAVIQQVQKRGKRDRDKNRDRSRDKDGGSSVSMGSESGEDLGVDDVLDDFRHRIANLEEEIQAVHGNLEESKIRIKVEVGAQIEQAVEKKFQTICQALEGKLHKQFAASLPDPHAIPSKGKVVKASTEMPTKAQAASGPAERQRQLSIHDSSSSNMADLKSQVLAVIKGEMATLREEMAARQELLNLEERMKVYMCEQLRAETRARMGGHQQIMKEFGKEAKARLLDGFSIRKKINPSNGASNDVSRVVSEKVIEHMEVCERSEVPMHFNNERALGLESSIAIPKELFDLQIGNVASRCASLAERLRCNTCNIEGQVSVHLMHFANDLEKVARYLSGELQRQLESMSRSINSFKVKLETTTKDLLSAAPRAASKLSTLEFSPAPRSSTVRDAPSLPSAAVTRMLSAGEALKMLIPNSGSPGEAEEVCLGSPLVAEREVCTSTASLTARAIRLGSFSSTAPDFCTGTPRLAAREAEVCSDTTCSTVRELCLGTPKSVAREVCSGTPVSTGRESCVGTPHSVARDICFGTPGSAAREPSVSSPNTPRSFAPSLKALGPGTPRNTHREVDV